MPRPAPPCAVEISATFGDTVLAVHHCVDPRGGRLRAATVALLALGPLAAVAATTAFAAALTTAAHDEAARVGWLAVHHTVRGFRPHPLGLAVDLSAPLGALTAITTLALGLARARRERRPAGFHVGAAPGLDLTVPGLDDLALILPDGDGFACQLAADQPPLPVTHATRLRLDLGPTTLHIAGVAPPRALPPAGLPFERRAIATFLAVLGGHLALVALLAIIPPDDDRPPERDPEPSPILVALGAMDLTERCEPSAGRAGPPDGAIPAAPTFTLPLSAHGVDFGTTPRPSLTDLANAEPLTRAEAIEQARHAGIFGVPAPFETSHLAALFGDLPAMTDTTLWGGVIAPDMETRAAFGVGRGGFGLTCDDQCKPGDVGYTRVTGDVGYGHAIRDHGWDAPRLRGHRVTITCTLGTPILLGDGDNHVRRYIHRHLDKLRYCYERALLADPSLEGTVTSRFVIGPQGNVLASEASGVADQVSACVADVIAHIDFPAQAGTSQVTYPFFFRAAR